MNRDYKKNNGVFETPINISKYLVSKIDFSSKKNILEPGFGSGSFLKNIISNLTNQNLFGIEKDQSFYLKVRKKVKYKYLNILNDSFFSNTTIDKNKYDLIIGNPPYGAKLDERDKQYVLEHPEIFPEFSKESSILFLYKSIYLLKKGGEMKFILPSTFLRVKSYKFAREYLLKKCNILSIINLGQKFTEVGYELVAIHVKKNQSTQLIPEKIQIIDFSKDYEKKHLLNYKYFSNQNIYPLFVDNSDVKILKKIEKNTVLLEEIARAPRGKSYKIFGDPTGDDSKRIYCARNISKYSVIDEKKFYINERFKEHLLYPKIIIQNLAYKIVGLIDYYGLQTNETVNNIFITNSDYSYEYIMAILNSKLMNYYIQKKVTNMAKLNIHMDLAYCGKIPIKKITKVDQKKIIDLVKKIQNGKSVKDNRNILENILFSLYGVKEKDIIGKYIAGKKNI